MSAGNRKIYLHETIDITLHGRAAYMEHMADFIPTARVNKGMLGVGIWGTIGSTDRWPEVVNLWELDGWHGVARSLDHETSNATLQDPDVEAWWAEAAQHRSGGFDRLLIPAPYSPTLEQMIADGIRGHVYQHLQVRCAPGGAGEVLDVVAAHRDDLERFGASLVGAYETAQVNRTEAILIFGLSSWERWADLETEWIGGKLDAFRTALADAAEDWKAKVLRPSPRSPIDCGVIA